MTVNKGFYTIVNIWTAESNTAIPGVNVGHVSLTTSEEHISLWPGSHREEEAETDEGAERPRSGFFEELKRSRDKLYKARDTKYHVDYDIDCAMEGSHESEPRIIGSIRELQRNEVAYRFDTLTGNLEHTTDIPPYCLENHSYLAIKPVPANVRIVLYSLLEEEVHNEFDRLKKTITGWSLAGSNFLTRNFQEETNENCCSIAYRCLKAAGLYDGLKSHLSSEMSIAVSVEDLLRHVVATKELELKNHPETAKWHLEGVEETPLDVIKKAYEAVGEEANANKPILPKLKPTVPITVCSLF